MKIICWNARHLPAVWYDVAALDAHVVLLQEACEPPAALAGRMDVEAEPWRTDGQARRHWRTTVVGLLAGLRIDRIATRSNAEARPTELSVSRLGTLAAARVENPSTLEWITFVSMYAPWEKPHPSAGGSWIFADASAQRLISDVSALVGKAKGHRIIAAGDLNCLHGHGEHGNAYWAARYQTIFDRFSAIGLPVAGAQAPAGRQAFPWPGELPRISRNVPTYYTSHQTLLPGS